MSGMTNAGSTSVTVAICTRNRAQLLRECLSALHAQAGELGSMQVLVVDNGSTDDTQQVMIEFATRFTYWLGVKEPRVGLSHARNRALACAGTEWIAFLDDDARPLAGYASRLRALADKGEFDCVGGVYLPWYRDGRKSWFRDSYASNAAVAGDAGPLPEGRFASGGVMLVRIGALLGVGTFDPRLGMAGGQMGYGEETLLQVALRRAGGRLGFDPQWRIEHLVPPAKQRVSWLLLSAWTVGRDSWLALGRQPGVVDLLRMLRRLFSRPVIGLWRESRGRNESRAWQNLVLAAGRPFLLTLGELVAGVRLMLAR